MAPHSIKQDAFTIVELVMVLSIIGILAAVSVAGMAHIVDSGRLRSAGRKVFASLQELKMRAVREACDVKFLIRKDPVAGFYFYDTFVDEDDDNAIDTGEKLGRTVLDNGLILDCSRGIIVGFNSRGLPSNGNKTLTISRADTGTAIKIVVNSWGNIRVK